jgi:hypothetical protein
LKFGQEASVVSENANQNTTGDLAACTGCFFDWAFTFILIAFCAQLAGVIANLNENFGDVNLVKITRAERFLCGPQNQWVR